MANKHSKHKTIERIRIANDLAQNMASATEGKTAYQNARPVCGHSLMSKHSPLDQ
jgi:hypothetical protein